jgi:hypothetical protein
MLGPLLLAASLQIVQVDAAANRHPISPEIYGSSFAPGGKLPGANAPLFRWGGNATTRYNWQENASSRGSDWYFESISEEGGPNPSAGVDNFIDLARYQGSDAMITIPTIGWVAKLFPGRGKLASFSISKYGPQNQVDPFWDEAGNGIRPDGTRIENDPTDANMQVGASYQLGWIQHLAARNVRYAVLDNEPSLWQETHRDVHPTGATMDEIAAKSIEMARLVKSTAPSMLVAGPEEWGWPAFFYSGYDQQWGAAHQWSSFPDRAAHGDADYLPWLLDQFRIASAAANTRLLDVLTVHFYPQGGEVSNDVTPEMELRRNRSTRALWDPSYHDDTWIDANVRLIPRLREWVNAHYPGTRIGITEYNWGAETDMNGGTAQADILGIFGREGLDLATRWTAPPSGSPVQIAMNMYRNYDGHGHGFGDVSVAANVANPDDLSAFAAVRTSDGRLTVMVVNKALSGTTTAQVNLANFAAGARAEAYQLANLRFARLADVAIGGATLSLDVPAKSVTLLVIPAGTPPRQRSVRH